MRPSFALCALLAFACHHDPPTEKPEPTQQQPLPPASGTPIGYLLDAAGTLSLNDAQIVKLHEIDDGLAADLSRADAKAHAPAGGGSGSGAPQHSGHGSRGGGGGFSAGMRGGGMGGMGRRGGRNRPSYNTGGGSGSDPSQARAAASAQDRATLVHDALVRAFDILEPNQRVAAKKVLADHDVDVDAPVGEEPAPGSPDDSERD